MGSSTIKEKTPMTMVEVKTELNRIQKRDETLGIRGDRTLEYLNHFSTISAKDVKEMKKQIAALEIPRMNEEHATKIIDLLPDTEDKVKLIFSGASINITKDAMKKIVDVVKQFK